MYYIICNTKQLHRKVWRMKKINGRIISLLTSAALLATGTAPQAFAEAVKDGTSETTVDYTVPEQNEDEEQAYITGELEDLRTRYSKTYEQSDGSRIAIMSAAPVHFYDDEKEDWEEYDNRLTYNEETEKYESDENGSDMQVSLPENIDGKSNIEVEAEGCKVSLTPIDMNYSSAKKTNEKRIIKKSSEKSLKKYSLEDYVSDSVLDAKVEYTQDESEKVEYIFSGSRLKENIVLSKMPEEKQIYSFRIKADGLTAKLKKDNSVKLSDSDNKAVFVIPAPYMYDENFEFSSEIKTKLKKDGEEYILTYEPDQKWLTDEERAYPVTVDPTISTKPYNDKIVDTSVISAAPLDLSSNPNLYAGAGGNGNVKMDAYINFTKLPYIDKQWTMSNAKLNLKTASDKDNKINAYRITSSWKTSTVKANAPKIDSTILDVCSVPSEKDKWVYWDITNTVYDWYNGGENFGIKLSSPYAKNNQSVFYSAAAANSENIPYISMEYTTVSQAQLENSRTIDIGRAGTATINDFSGSLMLTREDIGVDGNVMPVNISMIYNLNQINASTFGYCFRTNYSQMISYKSDLGRNKFYEYVCDDGSTVYFDEDEETGEYTDRSGRGYTLTNKGTSDSSYSNIVITDANSYEYSFDKYGRLIKITDTNVNAKPSIEVAYNGDYTKLYEIDYIKDGVGRKYDFSYTDGKLTDISYYGNTNTVLKKVSYDYTNATLAKVTYPDGKWVNYSWKTYCLASAVNTDGYSIDFEYTSNSINLPKKVTAVTEYGSRGTKGGDISIEYSPCQTKYINNNTGDTETLTFSADGDLISTYNSNGDVTVNEYAKSSDAHGLSSLINTYENKKSDTNLLKNGEFESGLADWLVGNNTDSSWDSIGHPGNDKSVKLNGSPDKVNIISQEYGGISEGETFEIGGWAKANASPQNPFNITVTFFNAARIVDVQTIKFNPYCTDWQYAIKSFKMENVYTHFTVAINYSNQINEAYFDVIVVYKDEEAEEATVSTSEITTVTEETTEPEPVTSIGSDGSVTTSEETDGIKTVSVVDKYGNVLSDETIIDGVSLKESNKYSYNGNYLKSSIDALGNESNYGYDLSSGNLDYVTSSSGSTVKYVYDKLGNITKVSQNISGLSNGELVEKSYLYDSGNRQSKIIIMILIIILDTPNLDY